MKIYAYQSKTYDNLWQLRTENKNLVFPRDPDDAILAALGIVVSEIPDPAPDPDEEARLEKERKIAQIDMETRVIPF